MDVDVIAAEILLKISRSDQVKKGKIFFCGCCEKQFWLLRDLKEHTVLEHQI